MDWPSFLIGMMAGGILVLVTGFIVIVIDPDWF